MEGKKSLLSLDAVEEQKVSPGSINRTSGPSTCQKCGPIYMYTSRVAPPIQGGAPVATPADAAAAALDVYKHVYRRPQRPDRIFMHV